MGRIKTTLVKRSGNKLFKLHKTEFGKEFDKNKKIVSEKADIPSKKLRNGIAGYITRIVTKTESKK